MVAVVARMLTFLQRPQQFSIPIFQRRYSWTEKDCQQLLNDILRVGSNDEIESYFLGSIVYIDRQLTAIGAVPKPLVIDGQQRLTTLSLLLSALSLAIEEKGNDIGASPERLQNYYLFNDQEEGELRYKLLLTKDDKETLIHLLENREPFPPTNPSSLLVKNYEFFENRLKKVDLKALYMGLEKLMIVSIALNPATDDPQKIFESLNSTGVTLSQADLIRNYVLMNLEPAFQNKLYENYWFPMEQLFGSEYAKRFDPFMRNYLTLKMEQIPSRRKIYEKFKDHHPVNDNSEQLEEIVKEISRHAKYYVDIVLLKEMDPELQKCFADLEELRAEVAYPFLLEVYDDYKQGRIEKADVITILQLVESYVFRRSICDVSTAVMNKLFAALMNEVDKNNYIDSLNNAFLAMRTYRRYPTDSEFKEAFINKDVYNFTRRNYLLRKLENYEHSKEPIEVSGYTIEHVMPQKLTEAWQQELGEDFQRIHEVWLHKIGNLTLTGYNPEYSNLTFKKKRDMDKKGLSYSRLHLNQSFANTEQWNEDAIIARAEKLAEKACKIWIYPGA